MPKVYQINFGSDKFVTVVYLLKKSDARRLGGVYSRWGMANRILAEKYPEIARIAPTMNDLAELIEDYDVGAWHGDKDAASKRDELVRAWNEVWAEVDRRYIRLREVVEVVRLQSDQQVVVDTRGFPTAIDGEPVIRVRLDLDVIPRDTRE